MAYTKPELEAIIVKLESRAGGVAEIEFDGRRTKYSTSKEIFEAIRYFQNLLGDITDAEVGAVPRSRITRMYSSKGL